MMRCLVKGEKRADFVQAVERNMQKYSDAEWAAADALHSTDEHWHKLAEVLRLAVVEVFPEESRQKKDAEYATMLAKRIELLARRADLCRHLRDVAGRSDVIENDETQVRLELAMATRRCRKYREARWKEYQDGLMDELWLHWRARRFRELHQVRCRLSNTGRGPRRRVYRAPRRVRRRRSGGSSS